MKFEVNPLETLNKSLKEKVDKARINAFDIETAHSLFIKGNISEEELILQFNNASIEIETLFDLRVALEMLNFSKEKIYEILSHENAHANKADELGGSHKFYKLTVIKEKNNYTVEVETMVDYPSEWTKEKQIDFAIQFLEAPREQGVKFSPADSRKLRELYKEKTDLLNHKEQPSKKAVGKN